MDDWRGDDPWRFRTDDYGPYWLNIKTGEIDRPRTSYVQSDTPEYISPVTGKPIDGRAARREDLKRSGCVEMDPPKQKRGLGNARFAKKHGLALDEAAVHRPKPKRIDPLSTI